MEIRRRHGRTPARSAALQPGLTLAEDRQGLAVGGRSGQVVGPHRVQIQCSRVQAQAATFRLAGSASPQSKSTGGLALALPAPVPGAGSSQSSAARRAVAACDAGAGAARRAARA